MPHKSAASCRTLSSISRRGAAGLRVGLCPALSSMQNITHRPCQTSGLRGSGNTAPALCSAAGTQRDVLSADGESCVTPADFGVARTRVRPSAMREVAIEVRCICQPLCQPAVHRLAAAPRHSTPARWTSALFHWQAGHVQRSAVRRHLPHTAHCTVGPWSMLALSVLCCMQGLC